MSATETRPRVQAVRDDPRALRLYLRRVYADWDHFAAPDSPAHLVPLGPGESVVFGREEDAEVRLERDGSVSRRHARVLRDPDGGEARVVVEDLGSSNGTYVDGVRVERTAVAELGGVIELGGTLFVVGKEPDEGTMPPPAGFHARASAMADLWIRAVRVAAADVPALLLGELGTGKTHVARLLHGLSARRDGPFVLHNCSAIPTNLEEATLFGVVPGFIPGVKAQDGLLTRAAGGTLFLDELAEMPERAQARLLDAFDPAVRSYLPVGGTARLETDCRLVSATNRDVYRLASQGVLRHDLLSRLVVGELTVPPLRERKEDLFALFHDALVEAGADPRGTVPDIATARTLIHAPWVENVRGLRSLAQRVALGEQLTPSLADAHAGRGLAPTPMARPAVVSAPPWPPGPRVLLETLAAHGWKVTAAAEALGVRRETLARQLTRSFGPGGGKAAQAAWARWRETGNLPE